MAKKVSINRIAKRTPINRLALARVRTNLKAVGIGNYNLFLPETKQLANMLMEDEKVAAAVYGHHATGRGAMFVTPSRVIFVDKKPFFLHFDEFGFMIIASVTFTRSGPYGTVTLHTRGGDYVIRTMNIPAAENFVKAIEELVIKSSPNQTQRSDNI